MNATGNRLSLGGGRRAASQEVRANALESKRERILALTRCPKCGSQDHIQEKVRIGE
jgi:hypothetical protein